MQLRQKRFKNKKIENAPLSSQFQVSHFLVKKLSKTISFYTRETGKMGLQLKPDRVNKGFKDCCIFWPVFGCCALQMLVEICFFNKCCCLKAEKRKKSKKFAAKFSKKMFFVFEFAPERWSRAFLCKKHMEVNAHPFLDGFKSLRFLSSLRWREIKGNFWALYH